MRIDQIVSNSRPTISFEFFPPKSDDAADQLFDRVRAEFEPLRPSFVTVTYGAGGSTRERTRSLVLRLNRETDVMTAPHLTCVGASCDELAGILQQYADAKIENIVALRGDAPKNATEFTPAADGFAYANELVEFIKREFPQFGVIVAGYPEGHPETPNKLDDLDNLKRKVDAGADVITTQLFFDNRDFYDFAERCEIAGIRVPIVAGIMPIQSIKGITRMAGLSGARIPAPLLRALGRAGQDEEAVRKVGAHWATEQCRDLLDHKVAGIHLYTLNKSDATRRIYESLGIANTDALHA
ncbi:MAG: methylenetetrahydrofolate reductase [NAD(P)H] [Phycisphaerales bacterium]